MPVRIQSEAEPIPGYKLIERIGGGGFGEVWKAEAPGGLHKAIKFVFGDLQTAGDDGARAEQELKALSRVKTVRHPYILSLERYDIIDGQLIIVMELADRNLWDRFKECKSDGLPGIPREELMRYMEESAEALDLMNIQHQLQHLDIKPHNIFLTHNHIKVADFGLVKDLEGMVASVTGGVTPVYAAPETFDGYVSRYCDQYSLAIVYQELLTGHRPFTGTNVRQLILQHLQAAPKLDPLPPEDRPAIAKALAKSPDERHRTCRDLVRMLRGDNASLSVSPPPESADGQLKRGSGDRQATIASSAGAASAPELVAVASPPEPMESATPGDSANGVVTYRVRPHELLAGSSARLPTPVPATGNDRPPSIAAAEAGLFDHTREAASEGVLTPAVVIGLGQYGLKVVQRLRREVQGRFGAEAALPSLRLLYIDTDPDATREALRGARGPALTPNEVVLARLNRPSHYLKARDARDSRVRIETWLDKQMLYRIPRSQLTTGVRALGRLAFCDNYAAVVRRVGEELSHCAQPEGVAALDRATGLGIRRYRPRVYIVTNLAGGTGSGMFLDLAYVVRHLLRQSGLGEPDVVGLCFLPVVDSNPARVLGVGNTFAALTELKHFTEPGRTFTARYEEKQAPLRDAAAPFNRCLMVPLPEESAEGAEDPTERAGELLFRELFAPLGRAADQRRSELAPPRMTRDPACQAFGMFRFAFPRRDLVWQVSRQLCHRLVDRWMSKDSKPLQAAVQDWVQEQWTTQELGAECFIGTLQDGVARLLGQAPETAFTAALQPLVAPADGDDRALAMIAPEIVIDVLRAIDQLVGRPGQDALSQQAGRIPEALHEASDVLLPQWSKRLTGLVAHLIEEPAYRLAGAEEAIRQIVDRIERALENHEQLGSDLAARAAEARTRIHGLLRAMPTLPSVKARAAASAELLELLRNYPKWRGQSLLLQTVGRAFVSLRGNLTDQLREFNFCRVRLGELVQAFSEAEMSVRARVLDEPAPAPLAPPAPRQVRYLLPAGCTTLEQAVAQMVGDITADDLQALDHQVQAMIQQQFRALIHVCMTSTNLLKNVQIAMEQEVARAVEARIGACDAAALFFELFPHDEQAAGQLTAAFDEAAPDSPTVRSGSPRNELCVLAVPATPAGERLRAQARQALPETPWVHAPGSDEIIIYREIPQVPLADLEQLGPVARAAYRQMAAVEHFTPHSRIDITFVSSAVSR